jgi:hypothetical protein
MNLTKSMTTSDRWFHGVIGLASAVQVIFVVLCLWFLWRRRILFF